MKKLLLLLAFLPFIGFSQALTLLGPEVQPTERYVVMTATARLLDPTKVTLTFDFGQPSGITRAKQKAFLAQAVPSDSLTGKARVFNGIVDGMNFLNEHGWEFVTAYPVSYGSGMVYHYLFRKRLSPSDGD